MSLADSPESLSHQDRRVSCLASFQHLDFAESQFVAPIHLEFVSQLGCPEYCSCCWYRCHLAIR